MFKLRGSLTKRQGYILALIGIIIFLLLWIFITSGEDPIAKSAILPSPFKVVTAYGDLLANNELVLNTMRSIGLNLSGYILALLFSIPLGFLIGLLPVARGLFQRFVEGIRFIPLTATIGIFIMGIGIGVGMKSTFMAFGIFIFLLPVVVQRIDEVKDVYLKTVYTLGATDWQTVKTVYIPSVLSRIWDDIRIMTAISWTYIVFVEMIASDGGLGSLTFVARRQSRPDKVWAILILFMLIGVFQDRLFAYMDRKLFPHKYQTKGKYDHNSKDEKESPIAVIIDYTWMVFVWIMLGLYILFALDELFGILGNINFISYAFGSTSWVIHFIFVTLIGFKGYSLLKTRKA